VCGDVRSHYPVSGCQVTGVGWCDALSLRRGGTFLELGAYDGLMFSNTIYFEKVP
jgi:hypothetical protein